MLAEPNLPERFVWIGFDQGEGYLEMQEAGWATKLRRLAPAASDGGFELLMRPRGDETMGLGRIACSLERDDRRLVRRFELGALSGGRGGRGGNRQNYGQRQCSRSADHHAGIQSHAELPQVMIHVFVDEQAPVSVRQRAEGGMRHELV